MDDIGFMFPGSTFLLLYFWPAATWAKTLGRLTWVNPNQKATGHYLVGSRQMNQRGLAASATHLSLSSFETTNPSLEIDSVHSVLLALPANHLIVDIPLNKFAWQHRHQLPPSKKVLCWDGVSQARVSDLWGSKTKSTVNQSGQHPGLGGTWLSSVIMPDMPCAVTTLACWTCWKRTIIATSARNWPQVKMDSWLASWPVASFSQTNRENDWSASPAHLALFLGDHGAGMMTRFHTHIHPFLSRVATSWRSPSESANCRATRWARGWRLRVRMEMAALRPQRRGRHGFGSSKGGQEGVYRILGSILKQTFRRKHWEPAWHGKFKGIWRR